MLTTICKDDEIHLLKGNEKEFYLSVLVGGVGQYEITILLSSEEVGLYQQFGDYYVQKLALDICRAPESFANRQVELPGK